MVLVEVGLYPLPPAAFYSPYHEVSLWSTTFSFESVWIIDEAGEVKPNRLQAE